MSRAYRVYRLETVPYRRRLARRDRFTAYVAIQLAALRPSRIERLLLPQAPGWEAELDWFRWTGPGLLHRPWIGQLRLDTLRACCPRWD